MEDSWKQTLVSWEVPEQVVAVVCERCKSGQLLDHAFRSEDRLESYVKCVLIESKLIEPESTDWDIHPATAALRSVWTSLKEKKPCEFPSALRPGQGDAASCALVPFLQASSRMNAGDRALV